MVAIFTGLGAGFERGSATTLGAGGLLGSSTLGRAGEGVFLNAANGNLIVQRQDEFLAGQGPDIGLSHVYNSIGAYDDPNNDDWRQSTDRRLVSLVGTINTVGSKITRVSGDGLEIQYTYDDWDLGAGTDYCYRATDGAGAHDKITYNSGSGVWTWEEGSSHLRETYELSESDVYRIRTVKDGDNNSLSFTYVSGDPTRLSRVTTADGSYVQYVWDPTSGNLTKVESYFTNLETSTSQQLTRVYYGYDSQNRLISVSVDLTPNDNAISDGKTYTLNYGYDGTSNRINLITQSDGSSLAIAYTLYGAEYRVTRLTQTVSGTTTPVTRVTDILYSDATVGGEAVRTTEIRAYRDATLTGYVATIVKSVGDQMREVQMPAAASGQSARTLAYTYNSQGDVTSITDTTGARTQLTQYGYDDFGNATSIVVTPNGQSGEAITTTRAYVNNNLTLETVTGSTGSSAETNLYRRYVYDSENHLRFAISAEGRVTEYEYEATGELKRTIAYKTLYSSGSSAPSEGDMTTWRNANGVNAEVKSYEYDARGQLLRAYAFSAVTSLVENTSDGRSQVNTLYDQSGALLKRWVEGQQQELFVYDGLGRLIASTDLAGGVTHMHFVDDFATSGLAGRTIVTTRAVFNSGTNDWDATSESLIVTTTYNRAGELTSSAQTVGSGGPTTSVGADTYGYDALGRLRWAKDATDRYSYFLYDDLGRKTADIGHDGQLTEYRYDSAGRLIATLRYATKIGATPLGNLANVANAVVIGDVRPSYSSTDILQWSIYDGLDRVIQTIGGDGAVTDYVYDDLGRLVTTKGYYNKVSVTGLSATAPTSAVSVTAHSKDFIVRSFYDGDGFLIGALNGEGYLTEYVYDAAGRKIQDLAYATATSGNRATDSFATLRPATTAADRTLRYVYDGQGLLRFTIDALGFVTELRYWDGPSSSPALAARQQATGLMRETITYASALGGGGYTGAYDYATIKSAVAGLGGVPRVSRFIYNDRAQLVYAIDATGAVTRHWYDGSGRVIKTAAYSTLYSGSYGADGAAWEASLNAWSPSGDQTRITRFYYNVRNELAFVMGWRTLCHRPHL
jgi:YD repeat-containing protein